MKSKGLDSLAGVTPQKVRIGRLGASKLADTAVIDAAREGIGELAPELLEHYRAVVGELEKVAGLSSTATEDRLAADVILECVRAELASLAEVILNTGSIGDKASMTDRRTREIIVLAAGQAMMAFPKTIVALVHLANHAIAIGLLRRPLRDERGFCVDLPTGNLAQPKTVSLLCPIPKSTEIVANYLAMYDQAKNSYYRQQREKIAELRKHTRNFLDVINNGEGETVCYVPSQQHGGAPMYLQIKLENGFLTIMDAAGGHFVESWIGFWIPTRSLQEHFFRAEVTDNVTKEQLGAMTKIRQRVEEGMLYANTMRNRELNSRRSGQAVAASAAQSDAPVPVPNPAPVDEQ